MTARGPARAREPRLGADAPRLIAPVVLLLLVSTVMIGVLTLIAARSLDEQAAAAQRRLAQAIVEHDLRHVAKQVYDYAWWDGIVSHVADVDPEWADRNIGSYLRDAYGFAATWVLGPDDQVIYGFLDGRPTDRTLADWAGGALAPLVAATRSSPLDEPQPARGLIRADGEIHFVGACAITPEEPEGADLEPHPRPVLVFAKRLDGAFLEDAAETYGLPELKIEAEPSQPEEFDSLPLRDPSGAPLGVLGWRRHTPGADLSVQVAPALATSLAAMLLLAGIFLRRAQRSGQRQRRLAQALRRERELRQLKSRFVNMVSHEIRTPLTTIRAASDLLLRYGERMDAAEREREIAAIQREVDHLAGLVDDVLAIGRAERDDRPLAAAPLDLEAAIREHWAQAERALGRRLPLQLSASEDVRQARLDPDLLRAILSNVFLNAIKFTPSEEPVEVRATREGGAVVIVVRDRGIGVPEAELDAVFEPFHRAANVGAVSGSGLGLAIVRQAVERHGGSVELRSREGAGCEVRLRLAEAAAPEAVASEDGTR